MKRNELTIGQEYLETASPNWRNGFGWGANRVRVIDTGRWATPGGSSWRRPEPHKVDLADGTKVTAVARRADSYDRAPGVLVQPLDRETGKARGFARIARPQDLRDTWEAANQAIAQARAAEDARRLGREQEAAALDARVAAALAGTPLEGKVHRTHGRSAVTLGLGELEALTDWGRGRAAP